MALTWDATHEEPPKKPGARRNTGPDLRVCTRVYSSRSGAVRLQPGIVFLKLQECGLRATLDDSAI